MLNRKVPLLVGFGVLEHSKGRDLEVFARSSTATAKELSFRSNEQKRREALFLAKTPSRISARKLDARRSISACYALDDAQNAFERLRADRGSHGKIRVNCS